jgi:CRISPR-associated endonuclease/helicase Cas3
MTTFQLESFRQNFTALTDHAPFPWQEALYREFVGGKIPSCCDLPTGLGKTSVLAIWLIARALGAPLPRRLVYVVDRRAVVDQATTEALNLRKFVERNPDLKGALELSQPLPISTLRGQYVDNRDWLRNPADPAIIVGTVDMIGSRLLFEGYGVSRKMRPFHAGFLGCDTLVVLDEAHLVPPFEGLLKSIANPSDNLSAKTERRYTVPEFKVLSLSATSRGGRDMFGLTDKDLRPGTITHQRLTARKRVTFNPLLEEETLPDALARWAWQLTSSGADTKKIIVFSDKRDVARKAHDGVSVLAKGNKKVGVQEATIQSELLVGGRRVFEREGVADWLAKTGFLGGAGKAPQHPTFVFATSAGEVGVDLDADHMVCDLVTWERMIQRFGRVNRRGEGDAKVIVVVESEPKPSKAAEKALKKAPDERDEKEARAVAADQKKVERSRALIKPFDLLPSDSDGIDVSPAALRELKLASLPRPNNESQADSVEPDRRRAIIAAATSVEPLRPALTRALLDAWSMTSLPEHTGRPRIQPWLRGWENNEESETSVLWRTYLPISPGEKPPFKSVDTQIEAFFEAAPPHVSEMLETETHRVFTWLKRRAELITKATQSETPSHPLSPETPCAVILTRDGELQRPPLLLADLLFSGGDKKAAKRREEDLVDDLADAILVLDADFAGLNPNGLLDDSWTKPPTTLDGSDEWLHPIEGKPAIRFRVRRAGIDEETINDHQEWRPRFACPFERSAEGEPQSFLIVEKWRGEVETPDDATGPSEQRLDEHQDLAKRKAAIIAQRLNLPSEYAEMFVVAACLHDEGKRHEKWQDAFNAPRALRPYAKTKGPINQALLGGFRHEFASLDVVANNEEFKALRESLQDLALHLIAAHHGFARPLITTRGYPDKPPSLLNARAREVAKRFVRLQRQWGPWGLAWWESLLRAADHQASGEAGATP